MYDIRLEGDTRAMLRRIRSFSEIDRRSINAREKALAAINASDLPEAAKAYATRALNIETVSALKGAWGNLANKYYSENGMEGLRDSVKIEIAPEQYAAVAGFIDGDDNAYLMYPELSSIFGEFNWTDHGAKGALFTELPVYAKAYQSAKAAKLSDSETAALEALSQPFYAQAAKLRQAEAARNAAAKLKECTVVVKAKAGSGGRLFGAVTAKEISDSLKAQHGIDVAKNKTS